jgi:hypothetical protein
MLTCAGVDCADVRVSYDDKSEVLSLISAEEDALPKPTVVHDGRRPCMRRLDTTTYLDNTRLTVRPMRVALRHDFLPR